MNPTYKRNLDQPARVLVVEDEVVVLMCTAEALADAGFDVVEADDADSALRLLEAEPDRFDMIFTDINLPGELDGFDLAEKARALRPDLPVLYASGGPQMELTSRKVRDGRFIRKPYLPSQICAHARSMTLPHAA
jgi:CheY-like chemotaxis protein